MSKREHELARAYEVGLLHGIGDRYDCRPFGTDYEAFMAYGIGRHYGHSGCLQILK